jgi:hypothetical protein
VQQQPIDMQQHEAVAEIGDDVAVPDLVEQGLGHWFLRGRITAFAMPGRKALCAMLATTTLVSIGRKYLAFARGPVA